MATGLLVQGKSEGVLAQPWSAQPFGHASCGISALVGTGTTSLQQRLAERQQRYGGSGGSGGGSQAATGVATARSALPPTMALTAQQQQQQQQQQVRRLRSRGCQHCVGCLGVRNYCPSAAAAVHARCHGALPADAGEEWWPAGLATPSIYFQLRRRQLHIQYKTSATAEASANLWRPTSQTNNSPSALLAARNRRPLGLLIPTTYTNVQQNESRVQLIGIKDVPMQGPAQPALPRADAASSRALDLLQSCSEDLPLLRRREAPPAPVLTAPVVAAAENYQQQQQQQQQKRAMATNPLARVMRTAAVASPAKRTRLDEHAYLQSPFAQASQVEPTTAAWWLQASYAPQQLQQAQQQPERQSSAAASLVATPECQAAALITCATGSGRASICLSSSTSSNTSFASDGFPALQSYGSQPLPSAQSVLPLALQPFASQPLPGSCWPELCAAQQQPSQPQEEPAQQEQQQPALQQHLQLQQPSKAELQEYYRRQYVMKSERAYPVVIELAPHGPAHQAEDQGVAAAISNLLRLLGKRRAA